MTLDKYRQKRDFTVTTEPKGEIRKGAAAALSFVVQKHAASHLHYDFRLELNGVLLSWAVPKGPSLDPNDKRLAMHVEDHPMEYGEFEGVIPAKQYGAGTVMLWDRGIWVPKSDPLEAYEKGRLKFDLFGEKLHGGWNLVRTRSTKYGTDKAWLLFKEADQYARLGSDALIGEDLPNSVTTGRTIAQIAADPTRVWHSNKSVAANVKAGAVAKRKPLTGLGKLKGVKKAPLPAFVDAQLATLVKAATERRSLDSRNQVRRLSDAVQSRRRQGAHDVAQQEGLVERFPDHRPRCSTTATQDGVARWRSGCDGCQGSQQFSGVAERVVDHRRG